MKSIIEFKEKHGSRFFAYETDEERDLACQKVMKDRLKEGYWYDENADDWEDLQKGLTDPHWAYRFMMGHSDYEYEFVDTHTVEEIQVAE